MKRTPQLTLLAEVLLRDPFGRQYAHEVMRATAMPGGTVYPMLKRLTDEGWLLGAWEEGDLGRPQLRYWTLTRRGRRELERAIVATEETP